MGLGGGGGGAAAAGGGGGAAGRGGRTAGSGFGGDFGFGSCWTGGLARLSTGMRQTGSTSCCTATALPELFHHQTDAHNAANTSHLTLGLLLLTRLNHARCTGGLGWPYSGRPPALRDSARRSSSCAGRPSPSPNRLERGEAEGWEREAEGWEAWRGVGREGVGGWEREDGPSSMLAGVGLPVRKRCMSAGGKSEFKLGRGVDESLIGRLQALNVLLPARATPDLVPAAGALRRGDPLRHKARTRCGRAPFVSSQARSRPPAGCNHITSTFFRSLRNSQHPLVSLAGNATTPAVAQVLPPPTGLVLGWQVVCVDAVGGAENDQLAVCCEGGAVSQKVHQHAGRGRVVRPARAGGARAAEGCPGPVLATTMTSV